MTNAWLELKRGEAPLILSIPHTGLDLGDIESRLTTPWLARKDTDWWVETLYDFADAFDATVLRTRISRTLIDVNRDPSGASLYPGQPTTDLCPTATFDGEPLYLPGEEPKADEIAQRRRLYFDPYHAALAAEIERLKRRWGAVLVYDCHSIRSLVPRLFAGVLPKFNLGTNNGASADPEIVARVREILVESGETYAIDGRFKGGFITRHHGRPGEGVHALQMELACRAYVEEPIASVDAGNWPVPYDPAYAATTREWLRRVLSAALAGLRCGGIAPAATDDQRSPR